ncbi:hypothetical protein CB0940_11177 [Cercospora beticola]|uniref:Apple domain-containing protein n=1 Tax=Cercospora beticola TaxID=122368 RepID=A0A2G5HDH1_CERBT|nr:hypothetical protein CB0940_11177 [Cercospora beticola]PIA90282.1 hypothetical protein CB0940_11177 [Cercospora beticola]WPB08010.1 hypothetical protein RHO25_012674 [Cercospora beticola]
MKTFSHIVAALSLLLGSALGDHVDCRTTLGTKSVKVVPRTTITSTSSARPTQVLVVQSTITSYKGIKSTSVILSTSTETVTDTTPTETATSTTVSFDVATFSATITNTVSTTTTQTVQSTSTTIIPTVAGFQPIDNTVNQGPLQRRKVQHPRAPAGVAPKNKKAGVAAATHPQNVKCTRYVSNTHTFTTYTTLTPLTNTMTYFSKTVRSTSVITDTSTSFPAEVTETVTSTSVSDVQTTTTFFQTSTTTLGAVATQVINGPTHYDACTNANNFFGPNFSNGGTSYEIVNAQNNGPNVGNTYQIVNLNGINTQEECCSKCQASAICETFLYRPGNAGCFLLAHTDNTCSAQTNHANFFLSKAGTATGTDAYIVGNGKCGYAYSANSDGSVFQAS